MRTKTILYNLENIRNRNILLRVSGLFYCPTVLSGNYDATVCSIPEGSSFMSLKKSRLFCLRDNFIFAELLSWLIRSFKAIIVVPLLSILHGFTLIRVEWVYQIPPQTILVFPSVTTQ